MQKLPLAELEQHLEPLFAYFLHDRLPNEPFGDFCTRKGMADLQNYAQNYTPGQWERKGKRKDERHRINLSTEIYTRLKQTALAQKMPMKELAELALQEYFDRLNPPADSE
jgi:sulfite reductase (ferredoxin)